MTKKNLPTIVRGIYLLCADRTADIDVVTVNGTKAKVSSNPDWQPKCTDWIKQFNVVYLTFIDSDGKVPKAMKNAAKNRGPDGFNLAPGTLVLFSMGGSGYGKISDWSWLDTKEAAEARAEQIAKDPDYNDADGFDFDVEVDDKDPANKPGVIHFVKRLRELKPDWIITQPVLGSSSVYENHEGGVGTAVTTWYPNTDWFKKKDLKPPVAQNDLYDSIALMAYQSDIPANVGFRDSYSGKKCGEWWCPVPSVVPTNKILIGFTPGENYNLKSTSQIDEILQGAEKGEWQGYMVWSGSVDNGFVFDPDHDARLVKNINYLGSKPQYYSCLQPGFGCSVDEHCQADTGSSLGTCFSSIDTCNQGANCGPFFSCPTTNPKGGCQKTNCDPKKDPSSNCFADLDECNQKKNCVNLYKCQDKEKGCQMDSNCKFGDTGCFQSQDNCNTTEKCTPKPTCKWYQSGTPPDCKNPSCPQPPTQLLTQVEKFSSIKNSKSAKTLFIVLLVIIGLFALSQIFKNLKGESLVHIFLIIFVVIIVIYFVK